MPAIFTLTLLGAFWGVAGSAPPAPDSALPGGDAAAFRQRMTERESPAQTSAPPAIPQQEQPPVMLPRLSSGFGYRNDPVSGLRTMHAGIDIPGPLGSPVRAAATGIIDYAGRAGGYGNMIEIDHGGGLVTRYAHLSRFLVASGARVERGQEIAMMGSTGRSTGSHLHFEVRLNGQATGPLAWLTGEPATERMSPRVSLPQGEPHISAFARARAETESVVGAGR